MACMSLFLLFRSQLLTTSPDELQTPFSDSVSIHSRICKSAGQVVDRQTTEHDHPTFFHTQKRRRIVNSGFGDGKLPLCHHQSSIVMTIVHHSLLFSQSSLIFSLSLSSQCWYLLHRPSRCRSLYHCPCLCRFGSLHNLHRYVPC